MISTYLILMQSCVQYSTVCSRSTVGSRCLGHRHWHDIDGKSEVQDAGINYCLVVERSRVKKSMINFYGAL